jgi:hypothetical protein
MSQDRNKKSKIYRIKIKEELDDNWTEWFSEMEMTVEKDNEGNPVTVLSGPVVDQAALNGLLNKIWNFNLTVISVKQIK